MPSKVVRQIIFSGHVCAEARAFLARTSGLDNKHRRAYIDLINGLVRDSVWGKLDALWMLAALTRTLANTNLVSASYTLVENPTPGSSPAFAVDLGYTGVAGSSTVYLDTGFNPSTAGGKYTQNDAHIALFCNTNVAATANVPMGLVSAAAATATQIICRTTGDLANFRINDSNPQSAGVAVTSSNGFYVSTRNSSSTSFGYKDAVDLAVTAVNSNTMTSANMAILGQLTAPSTHNAGDAKQLAMAGIGSHLTADEVRKFYARIRAYLTNLDVP